MCTQRTGSTGQTPCGCAPCTKGVFFAISLPTIGERLNASASACTIAALAVYTAMHFVSCYNHLSILPSSVRYEWLSAPKATDSVTHCLRRMQAASQVQTPIVPLLCGTRRHFAASVYDLRVPVLQPWLLEQSDVHIACGILVGPHRQGAHPALRAMCGHGQAGRLTHICVYADVMQLQACVARCPLDSTLRVHVKLVQRFMRVRSSAASPQPEVLVL
jgi:hypothetical protein